MRFKNDSQRKAVMASLRGRNAITSDNIRLICSSPKGFKKLSERDVIYRGKDGTCIVKLWNTDVATINPEDGTIRLDSGGYQTITTKDRINRAINEYGYSLFQKKGEWYVKKDGSKTEKFTDGMVIDIPKEEPVSKEPSGLAPIKRGYHMIDGWRGYHVPDNAIAGASDTGMWSDSPCPSDKVNEEITGLKSELRKAGIAITEKSGSTSNVFAGKRWVLLKDPRYYRKAMEIVNRKIKQSSYLHDAED